MDQTGHTPRILLVHEPPDGGVARYVMHVALGLGRHGFEVEVAGPRDSDVAKPLRAAGIPVYALSLVRSYARPHHDARAVAALGRLIRDRRIDLVHSHSSKAGVLARIPARATRRVSVYSPHCFGFVGQVAAGRRLFALSIERAMGRITDAIVCVSEAERRTALQRRVAPADRLHTILQAVPPCPQVPASAEVLELRQRGPVVGAINVLRRQKRVDVILDAIPLVWQAAPNAQFAIVGNGPLEHELRERARRSGISADERFRFLPFSGASERYLQCFDVFVLASDWEGLPISVLEAMACGVPQVATAVDGTPEAVTDQTGRLVPPGDSDALARALIELLGDPALREQMAEGSRARQRQSFTLERMIGELAQLYRSLLS